MKTDKYLFEVDKYTRQEIEQVLRKALLDILNELRNHKQPAKFYKPGESYNAEGVEWKYIQDKINKLEQEAQNEQ